MSSRIITDETTVNDSHSVTVPAEIRSRLDLEPGDKLRWRLTDDELEVEVVRQRYGAYEDLDPIETDEATDAVHETETGAYEVE